MKLIRNFRRSPLDSTEGQPPSPAEAFRKVTDAVAELEASGLPIPQQPTIQGQPLPALSTDLTRESNQTLGKLLSEFTAMANYVSYAATVADLTATADEHALEYETARTRLVKTGTVSEKNDKATVDPRVHHAQVKAYESRAVAELTESIRRNYERDLMAISREITRRGNEMRQVG